MADRRGIDVIVKLVVCTSTDAEVVFHNVLLELLNGLYRNCDPKKSLRTLIKRYMPLKRRMSHGFIDWMYHSFDQMGISTDNS
ncbi:MAG: hypothetical protein DRI69_05360 [Bacteroidetes bacterium]|nr:MAG: hypothetical protein DRI69_05360 [Bacteroidota bacterium]